MKSIKLFTLINAVLLVTMTVVIALNYFSASKIGYIDSNLLLSEYRGMQDARSAFQQQESIWQFTIDSLTQSVQTAIAEFEKEAPSLTNRERELSQELIRNKQQQLQQYQQSISYQARQDESAMTSQVLDQVNAYIQEYGETHGYQIILVATGMGNIAYAKEGIDLTDQIVAGLNQRYGNE